MFPAPNPPGTAAVRASPATSCGDGFATTHAAPKPCRFPLTALVTLVAAIVVATSIAPAAAADLDLSLASHYSVGDYGGDDDIEIVYVPLVARVETDAWMFKMVVPYLRISGGTTVVEGPGGPIVTPSGTEEGLGDVVLESTYSIPPFARYAPYVEVGGRLKLPTADDDRGLGTGQFDVTPEVELSWTLGRWTPYAGAGFRILGDPSGTTYHDGFLANVGLTALLGDLLEPGLFFYWKESASAGGEDSAEALPVLRIHAGEHWTVDSYVSIGFTDSAPDVGSGAQVHYEFEGD